jgi:hypothetical protein
MASRQRDTAFSYDPPSAWGLFACVATREPRPATSRCRWTISSRSGTPASPIPRTSILRRVAVIEHHAHTVAPQVGLYFRARGRAVSCQFPRAMGTNPPPDRARPGRQDQAAVVAVRRDHAADETRGHAHDVVQACYRSCRGPGTESRTPSREFWPTVTFQPGGPAIPISASIR